jgi:hypothetical protein
MRIYSPVVLMAIILAARGAAAQSQTKTLHSDRPAILEASSSTLRVSVAVEAREVRTSDLIDFEPGQFPETVLVIRSLRIAVNGSPIFVPYSAYADLLWVRQVEIKLAAKSPALIIEGGDGSESFMVRIEFDKLRVKRRALFSPSLPGKALSETIYHLRVMPDN